MSSILCFLFLTVLVLISGYYSPMASSAQVRVEWDPNIEPDTAGYKVYYGTLSKNYFFYVNVGKVTSYTLADIQDGKTYYLAATAYDTNGVESDFSDEITYTAPSECSYTISPANQSFGATGGSGTVNAMTQANCDWTATSNAPWVVITSNGSLTGGGTVNYAVSDNPSTATRTGTITVAEQTFTITQLQSPPAEIIRLRLDEGTGVAALDSSGNGNHGTVYGAFPTTSSAVGPYALYFDGINDYVGVKGNRSFETLKSSSLSVSLWVKHINNTSSSYGGIFKGPFGDGYSRGFRILDYVNKPLFQINVGENSPRWISGNLFSTNKWCHLVLTYDHQNIKLYQDGRLVQAVPETRKINWGNYSLDLTIGLAQWYFKGAIDDVAVYDYALTVPEIQELGSQKATSFKKN